ncbi:hypothetical protein ECZC10_47620 [Escherichia coli]|nr:hypothetical protein ECZC10_47620 [Escherichia coli]
MLAHPELDYNLQYSHYNGTVRNQLAADQAQQRQAIAKLAEHYGIMFFYRGRTPSTSSWRRSLMASGIRMV